MPGPVQLTQVTSLPDVYQKDHFELLVPNPPGGGNSDALRIRNQSTSLPGIKTAKVKAVLHRHVANFSSRQEFAGTFRAAFIDTSDNAISSALQAWHNAKVNQATGLVNPKSQYSTYGQVTLFNNNNQPGIQRVYYNLWCEEVAELELSGAEPGIAVWTATFAYDYWLPGSI